MDRRRTKSNLYARFSPVLNDSWQAVPKVCAQTVFRTHLLIFSCVSYWQFSLYFNILMAKKTMHYCVRKTVSAHVLVTACQRFMKNQQKMSL